MTPIATNTLTANSGTVTFSSIPQGYTDLILITNSKTTSGGNLTMQLNSDTGTNYSMTEVYGDGSTAASNRNTSQTSMSIARYGNPDTANFNSVSISHIMNYANSTTYKTVLTRASNANTGQGADLTVCLWRSTAAVTTISVSSGTFVIGSTFTLYGVKAA
jgi:hypothetical protein